MSWTALAAGRNRLIADAGRWRAPTPLDGRGPAARRDGRLVVSFASNDYLGLTAHPVVIDAAHAALDRWGAGSGSARLIVGSRPVHHHLEDALADWKGQPSAAVFPTGFAANLGVITALAGAAGPGVLICSDELNHASIIDACRLARADGATLAVYRHADVDHLASLLADRPGPAIVITDAVFSMDGDEAPLGAVADLCAERNALLIVDEAHAVFGAVVPDSVEAVRVGTLSKTLGALGGFVAGPTAIVDLVVNTARSYIFTTAPTPADAAAALAALGVLRSREGGELLSRLRRHVDELAGPLHPSPIVPIVIGSEQAAIDAARQLLDRGILVPAIRPPTVPAGTARLRVTLSAAHTDAQVATLKAALDELRCASS